MLLLNKNGGFSFIGMTIVLVITGAIVAIGANLIAPTVKTNLLYECKQVLNNTVDAVTGYALINKRLPRENNPNFEFSRSVGRIIDPWGRELQYIYDENLSAVICDDTVTSTHITVNRANNDPVENVAFIILSSGPNFNNQTAGTEAVTSPKTIELPEIGTIVDNFPDDFYRPEPYDDMVEFVTLVQLKNRICPIDPSDPDPGYETPTEFIIEDDVFVYGSSFSFSGNTVHGDNATVVIQGDLNSRDMGGGSSISVSTIYLDGNLNLTTGSASLGSQNEPGAIYVNGDVDLRGGTRDIWGDLYINGNFTLRNARIHGNVYVNGNLELGWGAPTLSENSRIYYTGSITHPTNYNQAVLAKCIWQETVPGFEMPDFGMPQFREPDSWYWDRGYASSGTLVSGLKIFADNYSSTTWRPTAENVIIVSKGDITITGLGGSNLTGILFAPNGTITFQGGDFTGLMIAEDVDIQSGGTDVTFRNIDHFIDDPDDYPFHN